MNETSDLTTCGTAARRLGVKSVWLKEEAEAGRLPGVRAGHTWLFHFPTILKLLEARASSETGEVDRG